MSWTSFSGGRYPDLRKTALYTAEFCRAMARCLLEAPLPGMVFGVSNVSVDLFCLG